MALIFMFLVAIIPLTISTELEIWRKNSLSRLGGMETVEK